jgi:hypothetical protein
MKSTFLGGFIKLTKSHPRGLNSTLWHSTIPKDMRFSYTYIYGALCPERDSEEAIVIEDSGEQGSHGNSFKNCQPGNSRGSASSHDDG